ncbi:MAG: ArsR/SmtB family transcription factor [Candidatus Nanoarchaeia archaeon]
MGKNNFLLLSLEDDKINNIANAVSNKTGKKILEYLSERKATESEITKALKLPVSTVHYNLQQLIKAGLVVADEFHYSEKGREMLHYSLANKYIIIAPQKKRGLKSFFKNILPVGIFTAGIGGLLAYFGNISEEVGSMADEPMTMMAETEKAAPSQESIWQILPADIAFWFVAGALSAIIIYTLTLYIRNR